ncbi:hypothetical protein Mal15_61660 [Stieleria maiorica]|uniref:DUF4303 domain-containing protein n=1 Tax=Stieleria maiorica TaxID=2795974 RepID=A0A5B9ML82_9BACT|nr:DUF4303 domain-containing protein [Stieleria maiorica]QEG02083.1 hypothetical protein Mal15_61660 [Stieleria maiorica]
MFAEIKHLDNTELLTKLQNALRVAISSHFAELTRQFDDVCGYAVCAPATFEHVFPAYQLTSELEANAPGSVGLATYFPPEWQSFGTILFDDSVNSLVSEIANRCWGDDNLESNMIYDAMLDVLIDLKRDGLFGERAINRFVTMWDVGGDESMIIAASEKLNSPDVHTCVRSTFGRNA